MRRWLSTLFFTLLPVFGPAGCTRQVADPHPAMTWEEELRAYEALAPRDAGVVSAPVIAEPEPWPSLPPAPGSPPSPEASSAAIPSWGTRRKGTYVPPSSLAEALYEEAAQNAQGQVAGLVCKALLRTGPKQLNRVAVQLGGGHALQAYGFGNSTVYVLVPLFDPLFTKSLRVEAFRVPSYSGADMLLGLITVLPLPFMLFDREDWIAREVLQRDPAGRYAASGKGFTAECIPVSRDSLERFAAPVLESTWIALTRSPPRTPSLVASEFALEEYVVPVQAAGIQEAAALLGWADPRVRALVGKAEEELRQLRERTAQQVRAEIDTLSGPGPIPLLQEQATLLSAWVDCSKSARRVLRQVNSLTHGATSCALRLRVRNESEAPIDGWSSSWGGWVAFGVDGRFLDGGTLSMLTRRHRRGFSPSNWVLPPGEEGELVSHVETPEELGPRPWLVRLTVPVRGSADEYDFFVVDEQAPESPAVRERRPAN